MSRSTIEARKGLLRGLLAREDRLEPWDRQQCRAATVEDLDLPALRDALARMGAYAHGRDLEGYLRDDVQISAFVPSLCVAEPHDAVVRPRNYAMLLFGRDPQRFIAGAFSICSFVATGERNDASDQQYEVAGTLLDQVRRLQELLQDDAVTSTGDSDERTPNDPKYSPRALQELIVNALAHRDYSVVDPSRFTSFVDRIEVVSPGPLTSGVSLSDLRNNSVSPKWRNQSLAWFLDRLQLARGEGQGLLTIKEAARAMGGPPPLFNATEHWVKCVLAASPRLRQPAESQIADVAPPRAKRSVAKARTKGKQTTAKKKTAGKRTASKSARIDD